MTDFLDLPTLIIIGVAVVVLWRLRSVLGTRTGNERPPMTRVRSDNDQRNDEDVVVPLRPQPASELDGDDDRAQRKFEAELERYIGDSDELRAGVIAVHEADPSFTPKSFLDGAGQAYEMIVTAFAQGDRKTLKELLDKEVYEGFDAAISEREAAGHKVNFTFVGLPGIAITDAEMDKRTANVTVRFDAQVVSATNDKDGNLVEGHPDNTVDISDEWTFARNTRSRDPNWKLVATNQLS